MGTIAEYVIIFYRLRYLLLICGIIIILFFVRSFLCRLIVPSTFYLSHDGLVSTEQYNQMQQFVEEYNWHGPGAFIFDFHETFSFLESVEISVRPFSIAYVDICTKQPRFVVNKTHILTYNNQLYNKNYFSISAYNDRPSIYVHDIDNKVDVELLCVLDQLDYEIYDQFTLEWINRDCMYLHDKINAQWELVFSCNSLVTESVINDYARIIAQKEVDVAHSVDVRFASQIVVYQDQKGLYG